MATCDIYFQHVMHYYNLILTTSNSAEKLEASIEPVMDGGPVKARSTPLVHAITGITFNNEIAKTEVLIMQEFMIDNGIVIDDIEGVMEGIAKLSGKQMPSPQTIKRFITNEKSTKFYIDDKCSCKMQPDRDTVYLWLDSGFTSSYGDPIMISLLNKGAGGYTGHFYGTMDSLAGSIGNFFPQNRRNITKNLGSLRIKYDNKISGRDHAHINDEQEYLIKTSNEASANTVMADLIKGLDITFPEVEVEPEPEIVQEVAKEEPGILMSKLEEEITIGLLLDKMEEREAYIDELLSIIERLNTENKLTKEKMQELEVKNTEYKRAFVELRANMPEHSEENKSESIGENIGHDLLGKKGRILVLGAASLDEKTMNGIAKQYGFERRDFVYETDYEKVKSMAGRVSYGERFSAIILGACPHKVSMLGDYSSFVEKCKNDENLPDTYETRTNSGELKLTKESFRKALEAMMKDLMEKRQEVLS